jgi:hypothetical protein
MGSFIALYGVAETVALIRAAVAGENLAAPLPAEPSRASVIADDGSCATGIIGDRMDREHG